MVNILKSKMIEDGMNVYDTDIVVYSSTVRGGTFKLKAKYHNSKITGDFVCANLDGLVSLEKSPKVVMGSFSAKNCKNLGSLVGGPEIVGKTFNIAGCGKLKSLIGAPMSVGEDVYLSLELISLTGIGNKYFTRIGGTLFLTSAIVSNVLGILKIKDLRKVAYGGRNETLKKVVEILNLHLGSRNINKCRMDLEDVGLEEYAGL